MDTNIESLEASFESRLEIVAKEVSARLGVSTRLSVEALNDGPYTPEDIQSIRDLHGEGWEDSVDFTGLGEIRVEVDIMEGEDSDPYFTADEVRQRCKDLVPMDYTLTVEVYIPNKGRDDEPEWESIASRTFHRSKKWGDVNGEED